MLKQFAVACLSLPLLISAAHAGDRTDTAVGGALLIRPFDVLTRRVFDDRVLKIGSDTFRGLLQLHHVFVGRFAHFRFGTYRRPLAHGLFEIRI